MRTAILIALLLPAVVSAQAGWRKEGGEGAWAKRGFHNVEAYDGRLWVFNGTQPGSAGASLDLWSSSDGGNWTEELSSVPWHNRTDAASAVFDGAMWMLGGAWGGQYMSDVWSTDDGTNWTEKTPFAPWPTRGEHQALVFDGKLWVVGGGHVQLPWIYLLNDLWHTTDGVNWTQQTVNTIWPGRFGHACVVHDGRMWVIGGFDGQNFRNDVWSSSDGTNWSEETASAPWDPRARFTATTYGGRIWVIGGYDWHNWYEYGDVWSSEDGKNWRYEGQPWIVRRNHAATVFSGRLWLIGGVDETTFPGDVWSFGIHVHNTTLPVGRVEEAYSANIEARGGEAPLVWTMIAGELPPGVTLGTSTSHLLPISGTPAHKGTYKFTLRIDEANGDFTEQEVTLLIHPKRPLSDGKASSGCSLARAGPVPVLGLLVLLAALGAVVVGARLRFS